MGELRNPAQLAGAATAHGRQVAGAKGNAMRHGAETAYVKVCLNEYRCDVYALHGHDKAIVGKFDNIEGAVRRYAARHASH